VTTTLMLRIASVISFLFAVAHSVLRAMTATRFPVMGVSRSYLDLYLGLGWSISVFMLLQAVVLWQMASLARADAAPVRPMIAAFALAALVNGVIAWFLIFAVPALFSAALLIALLAAYLARR
jgi:hypothetical protein